MLITPILDSFKVIDANENNTFLFLVTGGNQVVGNNLIIEKVSDNNVVYDNVQSTFSLHHILSSGNLTNGINYRAKIRTKDINDNWSEFSNPIIFWCYSKPQITIDNIDYDNQNRVYNQTVLFSSTYSQAENEIMKSYRYLLYNSNQDLIQSFDEYYSDGSLPLTQEIAGLENDKLYYLEVITISQNDNKGSSGLIHFKPFYIAPNLTVAITPENLCDIGAIKVSANILQILLELYDDSNNLIDVSQIEYIDDSWLDMNKKNYKKLEAILSKEIFKSDFLLQLWCKNIPDNSIILTIYTDNGKLELVREDNILKVYKYLDGLRNKLQYKSNEHTFADDEEIIIVLKQSENRIDLEVKI